MEPRSWVVELTEKLEDLRVPEYQGAYRKSCEDDEEWSHVRPTIRRTLRRDSRSIPSKRHDDHNGSSRYSRPIRSAHRQERSRSPPKRSLDRRSTRRYEPEDHLGTQYRQGNQTPWPSSPRRHSSDLQTRNLSPEIRTLPDRSLQCGKRPSLAMSAVSQQSSDPCMKPATPAYSPTYRDASYIQSSWSRVANTPLAAYHQDSRHELSSTSTARHRSPSTERPYSVVAKPVFASFADHPTRSSSVQQPPCTARGRTDIHPMTKLDPSINPDSRQVYRPYFMSRDQPKPSQTRSCFRGRQARPGSKGLKVKITESQKTYTVIDPRLPRKKPRRTELSTPREGHEEQFTDLAYEFWEDVERARDAARYARSEAESLRDDLQCNPFERFLLRFL